MNTEQKIDIYLAGDLFNVATRAHNIALRKALKELGYTVILPQERALEFFNGTTFDIPAIVEDCMACVTNPKNICVANSDGTDGDSGTSIEFGGAIVATGRAIVYRTDFRTSLANEVGINAMYRAKGSVLIYHPCFALTEDELAKYYKELAEKIHEAIQTILSN
jgi:nucleoside 2-deoxyribosyltransferase